MRGKIKEHLFINCKVTVYLPFSFGNNLNEARYSIYGNLLPVFSNEGSRLEEKPNSSTALQPIHFQLQRKPLYEVT